MRITKTSDAENRARMARDIANRGCNVCPCCGESKFVLDYLKEGIINKGILDGITSLYGHKDFYVCKTCGAEWKSDPY